MSYATWYEDTTFNSTIYTAVQPVTGTSYSSDSSAITATFTAGTNLGTPTYTGQTYYNGSAYISGNSAASPVIVSGLPGNTGLSIKVITTVGGNTATTGNTVVYTKVQSPTDASYTYDSSAITVRFTAPTNNGIVKTYNEYVYWGGNGSVAGNSLSTSSPLMVKSLYGNQQYLVGVKTTVDGNSAVLGNVTVFTPVQPPSPLVFSADSSAITATFTAGKNTSIGTITYNELVYDACTNSLAGNTLATAGPLIVKGLTGNKSYYANMKVTCDGNIAYSGNTTVKTLVQPPRDLSYTFLDSSAVTVTFTTGTNYSANNSITYWVYESTGSKKVNGSASPLMLTGLSSGTSYSIYANVVVDSIYVGTSTAFSITTTSTYYLRYYTFDNDTTAAGAKDTIYGYTPYSVAGTGSSVTISSTKYIGSSGKSLYFNTGHFDLSFSIPSTGYSISFWYYPTNLNGGDNPRLYFSSTSPYNDAVIYATTSSSSQTIKSWVNNSNAYNLGTISTNAWQHFCTTYNVSTSTVTYYMNGSSVYTLSSFSMTVGKIVMLYFGSGGGTGTDLFIGYMDNIALYNTVLTSTQVSSIYSSYL